MGAPKVSKHCRCVPLSFAAGGIASSPKTQRPGEKTTVTTSSMCTATWCALDEHRCRARVDHGLPRLHRDAFLLRKPAYEFLNSASSPVLKANSFSGAWQGRTFGETVAGYF